MLSGLKINRSTYYRNLKEKTEKDLKDYELIRDVFEKGKRRVGIRQIRMILQRKYGSVMNLKKIARIKRKYNLETQIRRKSKYRYYVKKQHEHKACKNKLNRKFRVEFPDRVYVTDITQLNYGSGSKGYLAVLKDLCTKEVVGQSVSANIDTELTSTALNEALDKLSDEKKESLMIHSDQGFHFTHVSFRKKLEEEKITQSMSRKGNCLDNAPVESFFGLIKDHLELKSCRNIKELKEIVTKEIEYYNNERPQLGLKKMPPVEYRRHLVEAGLF